MPMCDMYIPSGALEPDAERELVKTVSDLLVFHEMRRVRELMDDDKQADVSFERASSIAWMFVHRTETYVAGLPAQTPCYRFDITIPQGTVDDRFPGDVNRDIYAAVATAEAGKHPGLPRRLWTHIQERPDGFWGAGDRPLKLQNIVEFISPGMGQWAVARWDEQKTADAVGLVERARAASSTVVPRAAESAR